MGIVHKERQSFEVCAGARGFPSFSFLLRISGLVYFRIYGEIFTVSFHNRIWLSPLYANAFPSCLYLCPSIYLLIP